jgi:hypothetical protein
MAAKIHILEELGERGLLLPQLINRALAANDRIKYYLTLFQSARVHADHPDRDAPSLRSEREASGVEKASLDSVVSMSGRDGDRVVIPRIAELHARVLADVAEMLEPLKTAAEPGPAADQSYDAYRQRLDRLVAAAPALDADRVPLDYIDRLTRGRSDEGGLVA